MRTGAWFRVVMVLAALSGVARADGPTEEGRERFLRGLSLAKNGNCEGALAEFEASLKIARRPSVLYNIAWCQEQLNRYDLAVKSYEEYLAVADNLDPDRRAAEATLASLRKLLGTISIESNVEADVWLGTRKIGTAPGEIRVPGGTHMIELRQDGYLPLRREVAVAAQQVVKLSVVLEEPKQNVTQVTRIEQKKVRLPKQLFWGGVAATGACLLTGVGFGLHAKMVDSDARGKDQRLPKDDEIDTIKRSRTLADVFYVSAAVLGAGTTVVYFLTDWGGEEEGPRITPVAGPDSIGAVVEGRF